MSRVREQIQRGINARVNRPDLRVVPSAPASPWMTEPEVAEYTGFTRAALRSMRYEHRGPMFSKPGGRIRYKRSDIDEWMGQGVQRPARGRRTA